MTAQIHECLVLNGEQTSMAFCPPLPERHPRLAALTDEEIEALRRHEHEKESAAGKELLLAQLDAILGSSACWRGYQGTWEIREEQLFLVGIEGRFKLIGDEPLLADWFSGVLRVPRGERLTYVHMGFGSVYEEELHIRVELGHVTGSRIHDNRGTEFDAYLLGLANLPGFENRFPGDRDFDKPEIAQFPVFFRRQKR